MTSKTFGDDRVHNSHYGLNKREWFAAQFARSFFDKDSTDSACSDAVAARRAVEMADELIKAINVAYEKEQEQHARTPAAAPAKKRRKFF
jgi:hypothetical protein